MRKQDMQVGETYAYGNKNWGRREKIRIISLDKEFTVQKYRHGRFDDVVTRRVAAIEIRRDGSDGDIFPVESPKVLMTWAQYEREQEAQRTAAAASAERKAAEIAAVEQAKKDIERLTGDPAPNYRWGRLSDVPDHLAVTDVVALIEQAVSRAVNS